MGKWHKMIDLGSGGQSSSLYNAKIDLEARRRHHSEPLGLSSFFSC